MCIYKCVIYGTQKSIFFGPYGLDYFLGSLRRSILYRQMWPYMFFFNISVRLFFNKMLKNSGFAMPLASEPRPYLPIYGHIWPIFLVILKVQLRLGLTIFSIRYGFFLINDPKNCPLRDLAMMTKKNGISGFQVYIHFLRYNQVVVHSDNWEFAWISDSQTFSLNNHWGSNPYTNLGWDQFTPPGGITWGNTPSYNPPFSVYGW